MLFLHRPCKNNMGCRITVNQDDCAVDKPKGTKQYQKGVYLRVGGGFAAANSMIQMVFDAVWCIWACLQHSKSH